MRQFLGTAYFLKGYEMKKLLTSAMLVLASQAHAQDWHVQVHGLSYHQVRTWLPLGVTDAVRVGAFAGAVNGYRLRDGKPVPAGGLAARWQGERFSVTARLLPKHPKSDTGAMTLELGIKL